MPEVSTTVYGWFQPEDKQTKKDDVNFECSTEDPKAEVESQTDDVNFECSTEDPKAEVESQTDDTSIAPKKKK